MPTDKISVIVPCLWADQSFLDMTSKCLSGLLEIPQTIVVNGDSYAVNVNNGLRASTGDVLIICNNDIEFIQPDWLKHLLKPLEQGYDISSIRTTDADGWQTEDKITDGDKFGSLWAMKRSVYETIGPLDESFGKGYFEDLDYHKRAEDAGFKVGKNHAGLVEHVGKATFKVVDPQDKSYEEAKQRFIAKWGSVW